jgi:hypothetical protein
LSAPQFPADLSGPPGAVDAVDESARIAAAAVASESPSRRTPEGSWGRRVIAHWLPWALVALAGAYGSLIRLWLLAHLPLFGDEAVVGLMARGILHGRLDAFFWGQSYGGAEPYVVAAVLGAFNGGPMGLNATPAILALGASFLTYGVLRTRATRRLAALGAAMVWVWPYAATWNSVREIGFRGATLCCGLLLILGALRVHLRRAGPATRLLLGLAAGTGWWASPEIGYFVVPAAVLLVASWDRLFRSGSSSPSTSALVSASRRHRWSRPWRVTPLLLTVAGAGVGGLPWLYANIRSGFASLHLGRRPPVGYPQRLSIFFHDVLPSQLGLRAVPGGSWVGGDTVGQTLFAVLVALLVLMLLRTVWLARRGRAAAPLVAAGVAVAAFPFLYAFFPTSWYWTDGRYGVYLAPLVVLLAVWCLPSALAINSTDPEVTAPDTRVARHARRRRPARRAALALACAGLVAGAISTVATAHRSARVPTDPGVFFADWSDPNQAARQVIRSLEAHHIRDAYGDYWTAYTLDFLAPTALTVTPSALDVRRSAALAHAVASSAHPAWLFFAPGKEAAAAAAFANPQPGPGGYTQATFIAYLTALGDHYRVIPLGVLNAVVPDQAIRLPHPERHRDAVTPAPTSRRGSPR